jgi:GTPase involved in cell partitioning and DNA repair
VRHADGGSLSDSDSEEDEEEEDDDDTRRAKAVAAQQLPLPPPPPPAPGVQTRSGYGRNYRPALRLLADLSQDGATAVVARGGRGGRGNASLGHDTVGSQRDVSEPGVEGGVTPLLLELKAVADVGLVGAPNAGKSTLLVRARAPLAHSLRHS